MWIESYDEIHYAKVESEPVFAHTLCHKDIRISLNCADALFLLVVAEIGLRKVILLNVDFATVRCGVPSRAYNSNSAQSTSPIKYTTKSELLKKG